MAEITKYMMRTEKQIKIGTVRIIRGLSVLVLGKTYFSSGSLV